MRHAGFDLVNLGVLTIQDHLKSTPRQEGGDYIEDPTRDTVRTEFMKKILHAKHGQKLSRCREQLSLPPHNYSEPYIFCQ